MKPVKVAVPVTNGVVDGPGEGEKVRIYEVNGGEVKLVEEYRNPALDKEMTRGVWMLRSALERGAEAFIVTEIGPPGFRFLSGKAKVYVVEPVEVEKALEMLVKGELQEATAPTHEEHHHEHHHAHHF